MKAFFSFLQLSLRAKLILSYLAVALSAILILTIAVSIVVHNYFLYNQLRDLRTQAQYRVQRIEFDFHNHNPMNSAPNDPVLVVLADISGTQILCSAPTLFVTGVCDDPTVKKALVQAMHDDSEVSGTLQGMTTSNTDSAFYVSEPLLGPGDPVTGARPVVGAMFLSAPTMGQDFSQQTNLAIFIAGLIVSLLVVVFSLLFARNLMKPLVLLTVAAEHVKQGKYTERVAVPETQDELGRLALTFNEMANTIEADVNELRHQEQMRRDLLANIAHDLATPLTAIQGFSEALADEIITNPEERQETALRIGREVQRLRRMVKDIQQMSSLESGQARLDLAPLNMHTLVDETLTVIEPECEQMGISLRNEIAPTIPQVLADSDRITQVLLNLLDNARRHTPTGGSISVRAQSHDGTLYIQVSDTGSGIGSDDLPHIFERFYRADRARTTVGSGLGLSIVKAIITAHGGNIWAESTLKQGTRITFMLPLARKLPLVPA